MLALAHAAPKPSHPETKEERETRYAEIADALEAQGKFNLPGYSRTESALLVIAIAYHESGFAKDVDVGPCYRNMNGKGPQCDRGAAKCLMQLHIPDWPTREDCFATGIAAARSALTKCKHLMAHERLAGLSGSCDRGRAGSREIFDMFTRIRGIHTYQVAQAKREAARKEAKSK